MNYKEFIELKSKNQPTEKYHKHHILPRCAGGTDEESNIIKLTWEDHWEAHRLLAEENPENIRIVKAFKNMHELSTWLKRCDYLQSQEYSERVSNRLLGHTTSEETRKKISDKNTGHGHKQSEETRAKISNTMKGVKHTKEHTMHASEARKGKPHPHKGVPRSQECKNKIKAANSGYKPTDETREKLSLALKGKKHNITFHHWKLVDGKRVWY